MSMHLQRFVDRVRGFEARGAKDFSMTMAEAKDLHADITRLLLQLETLRNQAIDQSQDQVITIKASGGTF